MKRFLFSVIFCVIITPTKAQEFIPIDTLNWAIQAQSYVIEPYKGKQAIYLKQGIMRLKNVEFLNGTIEYDIHLKKNARGFPGLFFRADNLNAEEFYIRPHQSGNPDANQAQPRTNGLANWQLYHGPKYSFPYVYNLEDWTHVKLVVKDDRAQIYLDHAEQPNLSWKLFNKTRKGSVGLSGGQNEAFHIANVVVRADEGEIVDFQPGEQKPIENVIPVWEVSDKFKEEALSKDANLTSLINSRSWKGTVKVEEGTAANIARLIQLRDGTGKNTVFAKIRIRSDKDQLKRFEFGYSDRVLAVLNGQAMYRGTNRFRSRDYRYLGTIGLFDAIYLPLKKGENTLLMAVSEDFGGWLITGRFTDPEGVQILTK